jgi:hypothetical protein
MSRDEERATEFQQPANSLQATSRQLEVSQHFSAQPKSRQSILLARDNAHCEEAQTGKHDDI